MKDMPRGNAAQWPQPHPGHAANSCPGVGRTEPRILGTPFPGVVEPVIANLMCQLDGANRAQTLRSVF